MCFLFNNFKFLNNDIIENKLIKYKTFFKRTAKLIKKYRKEINSHFYADLTVRMISATFLIYKGNIIKKKLFLIPHK